MTNNIHKTRKEETMDKRWTVYTRFSGKTRAICQYEDKARAETHAASIGGFVRLASRNPQRVVEVTRRGCGEAFRMVGLPQY